MLKPTQCSLKRAIYKVNLWNIQLRRALTHTVKHVLKEIETLK